MFIAFLTICIVTLSVICGTFIYNLLAGKDVGRSLLSFGFAYSDSSDVSFVIGLLVAFVAFLLGRFFIRGSLKGVFLFLGYNATLVMLWLNLAFLTRFSESWTAMAKGIFGLGILVVLAEIAMRRTMSWYLVSPTE